MSFCSFWNKRNKAQDRLILEYNHLYGRNVSKSHGTVLASINSYHPRICPDLTWGTRWASTGHPGQEYNFSMQVWAAGTKGKNKNSKAEKQRQNSPNPFCPYFTRNKIIQSHSLSGFLLNTWSPEVYDIICWLNWTKNWQIWPTEGRDG